MKIFPLFLFAMLLCATGRAQITLSDSLRIVTASDWMPKHGSLTDSILTFKAIDRLPPLDTAGLGKSARDSVLFAWHTQVGHRIYGERLSFNATGESSFTHYLSCKVGETVFGMEPFLFNPRKICVRMHIAPWDREPWEEDRRYRVIALSETEMVWQRW